MTLDPKARAPGDLVCSHLTPGVRDQRNWRSQMGTASATGGRRPDNLIVQLRIHHVGLHVTVGHFLESSWVC